MIIADKTSSQISFLNELQLPIAFAEVVAETSHSLALRGWEGISSLTCADAEGNYYGVDVRYAWDSTIFKQHLFDFGWSEEELLAKKATANHTGTKLIIYLCESSTGIEGDRIETIPQHYLVGRCYEEVIHVYLLLPRSHPFALPEIRTESSQYATTAGLEKAVENNSEKNQGGLRTKGLVKTGTSENPLISIITVVYNGEKYLEQTIQSVINQNNTRIEYIVVDGGSTDATLEIIQKYQDQIDYWISEPDGGIYDAMNKGTKLARGTHTLHINADDLLWRSDALDLQLKSENLVAGVYVFQPEENFVKLRPPKTPSSNREINIIRCPVYHPGFIGINNQRSYFDHSYRIIADNIVIANKLQEEKYTYLPDTIAIHRGGGISAENGRIGDSEIARAVMESKNIPALLSLGQKFLYSMARDIAKKLGIVTLRRKYF